MRYYRIDVAGKTLYTSHPNGPSAPPDPGALQVEFDIPVGPEHAPVGAGSVKVWGIGIQTISQAQNFTNKAITVYGGMGVGLPLATQLSQNAGLLIQGTVYPAYGNWLGLDQSINFVITNLPPEGAPNPANLVVQHKPGDRLGDVVKQALTTAYPTYKIDVNVLDSLVLNHPGAGFYQSLEQFAKIVNDMSISMFGGGAFADNVNYPGIHIAATGTTITVTDGQQGIAGAKQIQFYELIGQPTWVGLNVLSVTIVMRGDLALLDMVTMPPTLMQSTAASNQQLRDNSQFTGTFMIKEMRHIGNSRGLDANAWATILTLVNPASPGN